MCPKGPMSFCCNLFGSFIKRFNMSCSSLNVHVFCCCICFHFQPCCGQNLWGRNSLCFAVLVISPIVRCLYTYKDPLGMTIFQKNQELIDPGTPTWWQGPAVTRQVWTVMFNAMCPADLAASGSYALWQGNLCSGTEAGSLTTTRFWTPFFLGARDLVHVFWQSNKGESPPMTWPGYLIFGSREIRWAKAAKVV